MSPLQATLWTLLIGVGIVALYLCCFAVACALSAVWRWWADPLRRHTRGIRRAHRREVRELRRSLEHERWIIGR